MWRRWWEQASAFERLTSDTEHADSSDDTDYTYDADNAHDSLEAQTDARGCGDG